MGHPPSRFPPSVKLILFDLDGSLRRRSPTFHEALLAFAQDIGYSFAPKAQRTAMQWAQAYWGDPVRSDEPCHEAGEAFWVSYIRKYLAAMQVPTVDLSEIAGQLGRRFTEDYAPQVILAPEAKRILWELREQHLRIGLVSNSHEPLTGTAIELGIIEHLDFTLASGQIGIRKPNPALLVQALKLAGNMQPEEAAHVGDNYYTDVIGAQRAGMTAVLLDEHGVFEQCADRCLIIRRLTELLGLLPR